MEKIKSIFTFIFLISFIFLSLNLVSAHCPLCTTGAAVGIGAARTYGVDDSIVGLFLGAFIASSGLWFSNWMKKKKMYFSLLPIISIIIFFLLLAVPFYIKGIITDFKMVISMPEHHSMLGMGIYGIDKLLFGMILGTLLISGTFSLSDYIKAKRGKVLFSFQGMIFMFIALLIFSLIFWFLTK